MSLQRFQGPVEEQTPELSQAPPRPLHDWTLWMAESADPSVSPEGFGCSEECPPRPRAS